MNAQESRSSPPSSSASGGPEPEPESGSFITRREIGLIVGAVALALTVTGYLHSVLEGIRADIGEVRTAVHGNAQGLAVVQTEIKALRRDIERVEDLARNANQDAEAQTTSGTRTIRRRGARSPI